jgi:hypothetical protein
MLQIIKCEGNETWQRVLALIWALIERSFNGKPSEITITVSVTAM